MIKTPDQIFGELFEAVQLGGIFKDSKTFVDLIPLFSPEKILVDFGQEKNEASFDLEKFIWKNFKAQTLHILFPVDDSKKFIIGIVILQCWDWQKMGS